MASKHFENKARQSYWVVHIEAWRKSGTARRAYCRHHHLNRRTFDRWMTFLMGEEAKRNHAEYQAELRSEQRRKNRETGERKRRKRRFGVNTDVRNRALQAFWAMHVEAMTWSGMGVREYAAAMYLSPYALRLWRDRLDDGTVDIDWRAHLHPSARPVVGTSASETRSENVLTDTSNDDPEPPRRPVRRFFTDEEKLAIALESGQPGVSVSQVARKHGVVTGLLFRWRVQFGVAQKKRATLAAVGLTGDGPATLPLQNLVQPPDGMMAVDLPDGRRVFAPIGSDPDAVRARVETLESPPC